MGLKGNRVLRVDSAQNQQLEKDLIGSRSDDHVIKPVGEGMAAYACQVQSHGPVGVGGPGSLQHFPVGRGEDLDPDVGEARKERRQDAQETAGGWVGIEARRLKVGGRGGG